jgi:quercetin dioxygenase-like cupin family protein
MAKSKKKESQLSSVGHAMIADTLAIPILVCDLLEEIQSLHKEEAWLQGTGPSSKTLVKHPDLRIILLAMRKNTVMKEHSTAARISVQTLVGHIRLRISGRTVELRLGQLLVLDQCVPHNVEAVEDSALLLTMAWQGKGADICEMNEQK